MQIAQTGAKRHLGAFLGVAAGKRMPTRMKKTLSISLEKEKRKTWGSESVLFFL